MRFLLLLLFFCPLTVLSQGYEYQGEVIEELPGFLGEQGYKTYRLYTANMSSNDKLSAIFGVEGGDDLIIRSTTPIFQHQNGGFSANQINCDIFETFPELEYDSFMTLGRDDNCDEGSFGTLVLNPADAFAIFEEGDSLFIEDGAFFIFGDVVNAFPDENGRVLIAQITTQGLLSACLNTQIFPNNVGQDQVEMKQCFDYIHLGCTDSNACNYDVFANMSDGSCSSRADMDDSGTIDIDDLLALLSVYGMADQCKGDLNADLVINALDILAMLVLI